MVNAEKRGAKLEMWGAIPTCYRLTFMCCYLCLPKYNCFLKFVYHKSLPFCIFCYAGHYVTHDRIFHVMTIH